MRRLPGHARLLCWLLAASLVFLHLPPRAARAAMVTTEAVALDAEKSDRRDEVRAFLDREEVRRQLESLGIDPAEAKARVDSLSDAEVAEVAGRIDQLPAGGFVSEGLLLWALIPFIIIGVIGVIGLILYGLGVLAHDSEQRGRAQLSEAPPEPAGR